MEFPEVTKSCCNCQNQFPESGMTTCCAHSLPVPGYWVPMAPQKEQGPYPSSCCFTNADLNKTNQGFVHPQSISCSQQKNHGVLRNGASGCPGTVLNMCLSVLAYIFWIYLFMQPRVTSDISLTLTAAPKEQLCNYFSTGCNKLSGRKEPDSRRIDFKSGLDDTMPHVHGPLPVCSLTFKIPLILCNCRHILV